MSKRTQGAHAYLLQVSGESEITTAQLQSAIKRINDRLYQLQKAGATNSTAWHQYQNFADNHGGIGYTQPRNGKGGGRAKLNITPAQLREMSDKQRKEILALDRHGGSWGNVKERGINYLNAKNGDGYINPRKKLSKSQVDEIVKAVNKLGEIHQFIEDNDDIIYDVENATGDFIRGNSGRLTPAEVDRLFNIKAEYEQLKKQGRIKDGLATDERLKEQQAKDEALPFRRDYIPFRS